MKRSFVLILWIVYALSVFATQGALPGEFSVSASLKVHFAQGNLQYQASTKTWRFAANQYTSVGNPNSNISSSYSGWIDLFGWGTSGVNQKPFSGSEDYHDYPGSGGSLSTSINGSNYDWGKYNKISNGGNTTAQWRTLTSSEWKYLLKTRTNAANKLSFGKVNGIVGIILLPDSWTLPSGCSFTAASTYNSSNNNYTIAQWKLMEQAGAVFLPLTGYRHGNGISSYGTTSGVGHYWASTVSSVANYWLYAWHFSFYVYANDGRWQLVEASANPAYLMIKRYNGAAVRLVQNKNTYDATTYKITWKNWDGTTLATTSVAQGVMPSYTGSTPTRPSTTQYTYTFSGWTPAITAATANKTYTATYTATPRYTITFNANGGLIPTGGNMGNTPSGHITTLSTDRTSGTVVVTKDKSHFQTMTNDCPSREGYTFAGWYTDPTSGVQVYDNTGYRVVGTYWNNEGKWIGTSNVTLYAHWTSIPYTITVSSSNLSQGTTTGGGTYGYGTKLQITATPNECYQFTQWSDGNTDNPRTIIVNGDATYTAEFSSVQYTIKVESADESQGAVSVELVSTVGKEKDRIYYTSSDGNIVTPYSATVFGANIVSNTYQDGQGVIIFDRPVVSIGEDAFRGCSSLTSITIPNIVTSIGDRAFEECHSLTSVTIPNSVTSIGVEAFYRCKALASIVIPNGVTSIGKSTFIECISLTSVTIPNSVTSIGRTAFSSCTSLTSITIPNSVTSIGEGAFDRCSSLTSITIPNSVTSIGAQAFWGCSSLTSVTIGNSVTSIEMYAFHNCTSLTSVTFKGLTPPTIGGYVFNNTNNCPIYVPYGTKDAYVTALNVNNTIDASRVIEK